MVGIKTCGGYLDPNIVEQNQEKELQEAGGFSEDLNSAPAPDTEESNNCPDGTHADQVSRASMLYNNIYSVITRLLTLLSEERRNFVATELESGWFYSLVKRVEQPRVRPLS